ncbi:MAG: hypothetical protein NTY66_02820 [Candidatus Vogelbacteria bacterium]|nr:hypothetical protein [Candidatus Vogelbacteria bacterium]
MSKDNSKPVLIAGLSKDFFVRVGLDDNRVLYLAELYEAGVDIDPILITADGRVVDGRHRIAAHEFLDRDTIEAVTTLVTDEAELIGMAYKANCGGALPPSTADTEHTVRRLLDLGKSPKHIAGQLGLPASVARKYISQIEAKQKRARTMRAVGAVTDGGLSIAKAAEAHGADPEDVRAVISGRKKKMPKNGLDGIKLRLTATYRSLGVGNAAVFRGLIEMFGDGDVSEKQALELFKQAERLMKQSSSRLTEWRKRFDEKRQAEKQ